MGAHGPSLVGLVGVLWVTLWETVGVLFKSVSGVILKME